MKGLKARLMPELCSRDLVIVEVETNRSVGKNGRIVIYSVYFPYSDGPPPRSVCRLVEHCESAGLSLMMGCDTNSHHLIWGSTDTNDRGRKLLEYLAAIYLEIRNKGNEPTFCTTVKREVIDLTFVPEI